MSTSLISAGQDRARQPDWREDAACRDWALASGQEAGIWGGLTEDERRRLLRHGRRHFRPAATY
jgi:hypothetical protein